MADPWVAAGAATPGRLRLWHTAGVLATLPVAAPEQTGFSFTNLLILAVVIAVFYPVQKKIREVASRRRRERWAREDLEAQQQFDRRDSGESGGSGGSGSL